MTPELTAFDDYPAVRRQIFAKVERAVHEAFPVSNNRFALTVEDVAYSGPEAFSRRDHRNAILHNKSLTRTLRGRYVVKDAVTGEVMHKSNPRTLAHVPYLTDHGTFVRDGVEYAAIKQLRLRPGVYVLRSADGYPTAQFNVAPGTGSSFRTFMDPDTGVFHINANRRKMPLYPILKASGVTDDVLKKRWGPEIWKANAEVRVSPQTESWITKAVDTGLKDLPYEEQIEAPEEAESTDTL